MKTITLIFLVIFFVGCVEEDFGTFRDSRDSKVYQYVKIGEQTWMAQNLAYLPKVGPSGTQAGVWVYEYEGSDVNTAKNTSNYSAYGCLYDWATATSDAGNGKDICPQGWHVPSDAEWTELTDFLGGLDLAGKKLKSRVGWDDNGNGDNSSRFNAMPGGGRDHKYGFVAKDLLAVFFSSTQSSATNAWYRGLSYVEDKVNRNDPSKSDGYSIRCVKDKK